VQEFAGKVQELRVQEGSLGVYTIFKKLLPTFVLSRRGDSSTPRHRNDVPAMITGLGQ
jgi:hypothetical protein